MPLPSAYGAEWRPSSDDEEDDDEFDDTPVSIPASPIHASYVPLFPKSNSVNPSSGSSKPMLVPEDWAKTNHTSLRSPQMVAQGKPDPKTKPSTVVIPPQGSAAPKPAASIKTNFAPSTAADARGASTSATPAGPQYPRTASVALPPNAEMMILGPPKGDKDAEPRPWSPTDRSPTSAGPVVRQSTWPYNDGPKVPTPIWPVSTGPALQQPVRRPAAVAVLTQSPTFTHVPAPFRTISLPAPLAARPQPPPVRPPPSPKAAAVPPSPRGQPTPALPQGSFFSEIDALEKEEEEEDEELQKPWLQKVYEKLRAQLLFVGKEVWNPQLVWDPKDEGAKTWAMAFVISLLVAFALDPMYLFVASAHKTYLCLYIDWSYVVVLSCVKGIANCFYLANMLAQFHLAYKEPLTPTRFYPWSPACAPSPHAGKWIRDINQIHANYVNGWFYLDCFALLPLTELEACLAPAVGTGATSLVLFLRCLILLQYVPRAARLWPLLGSSNETGMLFESAWASFLLNLFMYIMASHVVGAIWYWLAVQRYSQCLIDTCVFESESIGCRMRFLTCSRRVGDTPEWRTRQQWASASSAASNCIWAFNHTPDFFNYGIFNLAIPLIFSQGELSKYFYALQWGFTAISTLGGSSVPSEYDLEILFMLCITSSGLFLFAVLIGNIQNFLESLTSRTFEYQLRRRDMGIWMARRNLPLSLVTRVEELERLKWVANQGIDEAQILDTLTEDLKSEVRRHLYLDLIKKSVLFLSMEEAVLDVIFERLIQRIYTKGTLVIREGLPVSRMFFVLKGELESSTMGGGRINHRRTVKLKNGDFFGEELLIMYLERSQTQKEKEKKKRVRRYMSTNEEDGLDSDPEVYPKSENTVVCLGPVEGFVLEANDLEFVCKQFHKSLNSQAVQHALNQCSYHRRTHAAITLQLWYRRKLRERLGISLAQAYLAHTRGNMGNLMKNALQRKRENKSVNMRVIISKK